MKKDYPDHDPVESVKILIDVSHKDDWHKLKATNFRYIYYNIQKIIKTKNNEGTTINSALDFANRIDAILRSR